MFGDYIHFYDVQQSKEGDALAIYKLGGKPPFTLNRGRNSLSIGAGGGLLR